LYFHQYRKSAVKMYEIGCCGRAAEGLRLNYLGFDPFSSIPYDDGKNVRKSVSERRRIREKSLKSGTRNQAVAFLPPESVTP